MTTLFKNIMEPHLQMCFFLLSYGKKCCSRSLSAFLNQNEIGHVECIKVSLRTNVYILTCLTVHLNLFPPNTKMAADCKENYLKSQNK